jgi:hypothetical protein
MKLAGERRGVVAISGGRGGLRLGGGAAMALLYSNQASCSSLMKVNMAILDYCNLACARREIVPWQAK